MWQAQVRAEDLRLDSERRLTCIGSALVRFEYLRWNETRTPDRPHVEVLKGIFRKEGCRALEIQHHIPAIVDRQQFDTAVADARRKGRWQTNTLPSSHSAISSPSGYPELEFPGGLEYIHGCHRIEAAREYLTPIEKWWIVDLFLSDISYELKTFLSEEYANEEKPCDGEIYRKIRKYHVLRMSVDCMVSSATCYSLEMRWWARLKGQRAQNIRSLYKNGKLTAAFDALVKYPGLCDGGMMITTLHKLLAMKSPEASISPTQHVCNLEHIERVWGGFLKGIIRGKHRIDKITVKAVEFWAPGISTKDADHLRGDVLDGNIFSEFSRQERKLIWKNILAFKGIIPSLFKFFKDILFLQACVDAVKWLVTLSPEQTLSTALEHCFKGRKESQSIQTSETTFQSQTGDLTTCMRLGFLQLVAFAMRNQEDLPKELVKTNILKAPRPKADQGVLQRFATLADRLGFESPKIKDLKQYPTPPPPPQDALESAPHLVTTGPGESLKQRVRISLGDNYEYDKKFMFLHNLSEKRDESGEGITSFFVLKCWFVAFFIPPDWHIPHMSTGSLTDLPSPPPHQHTNDDIAMGGMSAPNTGGREQEQQQEQEEQREIIQVRQRIDAAERIQETIQLVQQEMSGHAVEANQRLEIEEETLARTGQSLALEEVAIEEQTVQDVDPITIYFVEGKNVENDMMEPIQEYESVQQLRVDLGDPSSLVERAVGEFLQKGKRTCNRYRVYLPADHCYAVATLPENQNTLFLIPDVAVQDYGAPEVEQVIERPEDLDTPPKTSLDLEIEHEQDHKRQYQLTERLQETITPQEHIQENTEMQEEGEEDDGSLLNGEMDNASNALILDGNSRFIYLRLRVGDMHDFTKPVGEYEWKDMEPIEILPGDPQKFLQQKVKEIWNNAHLLPHTINNKTLKPEECYEAVKDGDHTLYFMLPSLQTEAEKDSERTLLLLPPFEDSSAPILQSHFAVPKTADIIKRTKQKLTKLAPDEKFKESLQAEVERDAERTILSPPNPPPLIPEKLLLKHKLRTLDNFIPPPDTIQSVFPPTPIERAFRSRRRSPDAFHKDKIGRGRDHLVDGEQVPKRIHTAFSSLVSPSEIQIRPLPGSKSSKPLDILNSNPMIEIGDRQFAQTRTRERVDTEMEIESEGEIT